MTHIRPYTPDDYPLLSAWWTGHGVASTPAGCVPGLGMVASYDGRETFAAFLSMDNSCGLCYLLWPVSNPAASARAVVRCIDPVVELLREIATGFGYHTLLAMTHAESLAKHFSKLGFTADAAPIRLHSIHL